jgi:glycolate oxidase iron-sulfur subunit
VKIEPGADAPSFEKISACVHCGLCLEACPTYRELRVEMDSPRGRIYLMKGLLQERLEPTEDVLVHLDRCLDCRACETACPSGVAYGDLLEKTRTLLERSRPRGWTTRLLRSFFFRGLLHRRGAQAALFKALWLSQALGLTALGRGLARLGLLRGRLGAAARQAPRFPFRSFRARRRGALDRSAGVLRFPARGTRRRRVAFLTGCLADQLLADVNDATVRVLTENGCEVEVRLDERCCGALHIHNGARDQAKDLARANVRAFASGGYDALISNAAGCSAELRHYGALLGGDPEARAFGAGVRDVAEFLVEIGFTPPRGAIRARVGYSDPCHLLHAQKIADPPRAILRAIPGVELVPLEDAEFCCGSAGIYSVTEPELSRRILERKIDAVRRSGCEIVASGNPGCILQLRSGLREAGLRVKVVHPVELLAESYARAEGERL